jgi:hypothetical protein
MEGRRDPEGAEELSHEEMTRGAAVALFISGLYHTIPVDTISTLRIPPDFADSPGFSGKISSH